MNRIAIPRRAVIASSIAACLVLLQGCAETSAQEAPAAAAVPEVTTVKATAAGADNELRLPARAEAGESARLFARATGILAERLVDLGDSVEKGQVLARISAPEIDQSLREAEAGLIQAKADEELARVNFERAQSLIGSGAIPKELHSEREAAYAVAKASRAAATARVAGARERQSFQVVRAPFAGVISARNVERGDRVVGDSAAAATPLFELVALDPLRVVVDVPQSAVLQVAPGLRAEVRFPELAETVEAEVVRTSRRISGTAGGMRVELRLPNADGRLPDGMVGEVVLRVPRAQAVALVPISAVMQGAGGAQVATIDADVLAHRKVVTGRNLGSTIEILKGVAPGDTVIVSPNALLQPGTRVVAKAAAGS